MGTEKTATEFPRFRRIDTGDLLMKIEFLVMAVNTTKIVSDLNSHEVQVSTLIH